MVTPRSGSRLDDDLRTLKDEFNGHSVHNQSIATSETNSTAKTTENLGPLRTQEERRPAVTEETGRADAD